MDLLHLLPFVSTAITFVFAATVLNRYRIGRRPHSLMWGIGLTLYGLGTLAEAYLEQGDAEMALTCARTALNVAPPEEKDAYRELENRVERRISGGDAPPPLVAVPTPSVATVSSL